MSQQEDDQHLKRQILLVAGLIWAVYSAISIYPDQHGRTLKWEYLLDRVEKCEDNKDCIDNVVRNLEECFDSNYRGFSYAIKLHEKEFDQCLELKSKL